MATSKISIDLINKTVTKKIIAFNEYSVYEREIYWLDFFEKLGVDWAPRLLARDDVAQQFTMTYVGQQINNNNAPSDWIKQLQAIMDQLKFLHIKHNDVKETEVMIMDNKVYLIDFGWMSVLEDWSCGQGFDKRIKPCHEFFDETCLDRIKKVVTCYNTKWNAIISFGNCSAELALEKLNCKTSDYVFDWMRGNTKIIYEILTTGFDKFLTFNDTGENYQVKQLNRVLKPNFPAQYINSYGQYFTHDQKLAIKDLIIRFNNLLNNFYTTLKTKQNILFINVNENAIFNKIVRDNLDNYYYYLILIEGYLSTTYPNLNFKIINLEIDNNRSNTRRILNYKINYNLGYSDNGEYHNDQRLHDFRAIIVKQLKTIIDSLN